MKTSFVSAKPILLDSLFVKKSLICRSRTYFNIRTIAFFLTPYFYKVYIKKHAPQKRSLTHNKMLFWILPTFCRACELYGAIPIVITRVFRSFEQLMISSEMPISTASIYERFEVSLAQLKFSPKASTNRLFKNYNYK